MHMGHLAAKTGYGRADIKTKFPVELGYWVTRAEAGKGGYA